jgi:Aerotolerance regulator N-terminal
MFALGNPYGLLALLGIPAVLAIHFLQRKARELPVSTLFLLDHTRREAAGGRSFERLISSVPLWMQLLSVVLLAWFLAEPRYARSGSIQRVAVVLDASASMSVFKNQAIERLNSMIPAWKGAASEVHFTVLESAPNRPRVYAGSSVEELKAALAKWKPREGPIDPTQALRLARSLVSNAGLVVYLTDTPGDGLPFEAKELAVGEAIDNAGFTGVSFAQEEETLVWRALVRNHGAADADRIWWIQTADGATEPRKLHLPKGALVTLQAAFPKDGRDVRVVLSPDKFTLDDVLPLVAPQPKPIRLFTAISPAFVELAEKLLASLDAAEASNDAAAADLSISSYNPLDPTPPSGNAMVFVEDETRTGAWLKGGIVAEAHPLMNGLNWQSLLARETIELERKPSDTVLLWQDKRPLIFLRETEDARQLMFNFDPGLSNASKQPAFIVLLHRFAETIRQTKVAPSSENLETSQSLEVTTEPGLPVEIRATDADGKPVPFSDKQKTMSDPGFLTWSQSGRPLLQAAVRFGDPREADFSECATFDGTENATRSAMERHTRPDPWWKLWILLMLAALLVSWKFTARSPVPA